MSKITQSIELFVKDYPMAKEYKGPVYNKILKRINEKRHFIQVLAGPSK